METQPWVPEVIFFRLRMEVSKNVMFCSYPHPKKITSGTQGMETLKTIS